MVATTELQAAVLEALRTDQLETDQAIWTEYFFGPEANADKASRNLEFERIRAVALNSG